MTITNIKWVIIYKVLEHVHITVFLSFIIVIVIITEIKYQAVLPICSPNSGGNRQINLLGWIWRISGL